MKYIDVHAHYEDEKFEEDVDEILVDLKNVGVEYVINAGSSYYESIKGLNLAKQKANMYCTLGIHPYCTREINKVDELERIYNENKESGKVVAIGEIGLDYHNNEENSKEMQEELFRKQIKLAKKLDLPIQIHSRDASIDTVRILNSEELPSKIMFHCFDLNEETAKHIIKNGWSISVGGNITYKRSEQAYKVLKQIPLTQIMSETDSPYLAPEEHRGERNSSMNIPKIVKKIAEIKGMDEEIVAEQLYKNAKIFLNI